MDVEHVVAAHRQLEALADGLTGTQAREPSRLPGWTRAHVLVHLAHNARAFARQVTHDGPVDMYDGGRAARDAAIEEQAAAPVAELRELLRQSQAGLEKAWRAVPPGGWERPVRFRDGTVADTVAGRWREAEIHAVDLGLSYTARDWPVEFALHALDFLAGRVPAGQALTVEATDLDVRRTLGSGDAVAVAGPLREIVSWMAGRDDGGGLRSSDPALPALGPWPPDPTDDTAVIAELVRVFFGAFVTGGDAGVLRDILLPQAIIIRAGAPSPAVYDVEGFIEPRRELLNSGRLTGFREWEVSGRTEVFGDIAQHSCAYAKEGTQDGIPFTGNGHKTFQLVRLPTGWRISAVSWHDE